MYIGIDIGGTNTGIGVIDHLGNIIADDNFPTKRERPFEDICSEIVSKIRELLSINNIELEKIKYVGIGLPGIVDRVNGVFAFAPNISVINYPIKAFFESHLGVRVYIDNDANCAALAEAVFGSTNGFQSSITITIGTGIGGGIVYDKRLLHGLNNCVGEIGHMVVNIKGEKCGCGRNGCWEQYASASALRRMALNAAKTNSNSIINKLAGWDYERVTGKIVFDAMAQGDKVAKNIVNEYIRYLCEGITNLINIFDIEAIAIGGGISKQGKRLTEPINKFIKDNMICKVGRIPNIVPANFGREAGIIGATLLGKQM